MRRLIGSTTLREFDHAFKAALASGKPTLIDAVITRLAIPHYSPNPEGLSAALAEAVAKLDSNRAVTCGSNRFRRRGE